MPGPPGWESAPRRRRTPSPRRWRTAQPAACPPRGGDGRFTVADGLFASAVISHFTSWPRTTRTRLPWLTEREGLDGRLIAPYNAILYLSAAAAVGGAVENRGAWQWFALTPSGGGAAPAPVDPG